MRSIVLVGFAGAGKTTIGKRLASNLGMEFVDCDAKFEKKYKLSISLFFEKYGEKAFRECEYSLLKELLQVDNCVIATGGGAPCFFDAMDLILRHSVSVYIKMSPKSLFVRLSNSQRKRPLTIGKTPSELMTYIENTLCQREVFYSRAMYTIKGENFNYEQLQQCLNNLR